MAGLVPAIPFRKAMPCPPKRDARHKVSVLPCPSSVMPAHSRPKDGVLSHAYVPAISLRKVLTCQPKRDARHKAGHDECLLSRPATPLVLLILTREGARRTRKP